MQQPPASTSPPAKPPKSSGQPAPTVARAEPYTPQEATWWEESHSPHPGRAEQGYAGQGHQHQHQNQSSEYGSRDAKPASDQHKKELVNWNKVAKIIVAVLLPPLGVFLETGCDKNLAINALLTVLGYIPGILHALYVIMTA